MDKAKLYTISGGIARNKGLPRTFVAVATKEADKAVYLYGHGALDPTGRCCKCGRVLTHPGSILIGIGPECLTNMGFDGWGERGRRFNFDNPDPEDVAALKAAMQDVKIDTWLPKACILSEQPSDEVITLPAANGNGSKPIAEEKPAKTATLDKSGKFVVVRFPYDPKMVDAVRRLEGRKWNPADKCWTAWASSENLTLLQELGFALDEKLLSMLEPKDPTNNLELYFYLCPLYTSLNGSSKEKGEQNAKRSISENTKSVESSQEKLSQRAHQGSQGKSCQQPTGNSQRSGMEGKGIHCHKRSNAQAGNTSKTPGRTKKSKSKTRGEFQEREWATAHRGDKENVGGFEAIRIQEGISSKDKINKASFPECSYCLQNRLCSPKNDDSDRTGRGDHPQRTSQQGNRPEENQCTGSPWVDCNTLKTLIENELGLHDGIWENLYPFQREDIMWLEAKGGNGIIGSEMGLGKTIQALGWLKLHPELRPAVIVVPASLKLNWEREAKKWLGKGVKVAMPSGRKANRKAVWDKDLIVINYDILANWLNAILQQSPAVMIVDESHYVKSIKAQRTKAVKELGKLVKHKIFLTGTPIVNRPAEFFTVLNMLEPVEFNSWMRFTKRYCGAFNNGFGWDVSGATNTAELHEKLQGKIMIRRKKEDVLTDLPAKQRYAVPMEIGNRKEYSKASANLLGWLEEKFGRGKANSAAQAEALAQFNYLKQLAAEGKRESAVQWLKDSLDSNGKLVVFAIHHTMIDYLAEELRHYNPVVVDGRTSQEARQKAVDTFQQDDTCKVFIGNIRAAGVGLTLTAASNVVFVELGWTPGEHQQAEDRIHRIGQERQCTAWYLVAGDSIEETIAEILDSKRQVLDAVLDGKDVEEGSLLTELISRALEGQQ